MKLVSAIILIFSITFNDGSGVDAHSAMNPNNNKHESGSETAAAAVAKYERDQDQHKPFSNAHENTVSLT